MYPTLRRFWSGTHTTCNSGGVRNIKGDRNRRHTRHAGSLGGLHPWQPVLEYETFAAFCPLRVGARVEIAGADGPAQALTGGDEEDVRTGFPRDGAGVGVEVVAADDVVGKAGKDVLEMAGFEGVGGATGARGEGDGDAVGVEVADETVDAWEEGDGGPAEVLGCVALGEVVVDGERDVGEEGEEAGGGVAVG